MTIANESIPKLVWSTWADPGQLISILSVREAAAREEVERLRERLDPEYFASHVLDHIDTMYPAMWENVPKIARTSIRNTIINRLRAALAPEQPGTKGERE